MKRIFNLLAVVLVAALVLTGCGTPAATPAPGQVEVTRIVTVEVPATAVPAPAGQQLVIYMQMGGTQGDGSTLARTNGAKAAAAALNIKLVEQYSGWDNQKMIDQFKQAVAANKTASILKVRFIIFFSFSDELGWFGQLLNPKSFWFARLFFLLVPPFLPEIQFPSPVVSDRSGLNQWRMRL